MYGLAQHEWRGEHPVHERNEHLQAEIDRLKKVADDLRAEIKYLEEQLKCK